MSAINSIRMLYMRYPTTFFFAFILLINTCICSPASGQKEFGFSMPEGMKKVEIRFEEYNNLIVIPLSINNLTLKFILDTGVETAILTEKLFADVLKVNFIREITIAGPGVADSVEVYVANDITFNLPGGLTGHNMNMLVLKEDYLKLSENMGDEVYGIIGYDVFSRFIVEINYDSKKIILHDPKTFRPKRKCTMVPLDIRNTKPFLQTSIYQQNQDNFIDIMVDTGASHAALLDLGEHPAIDLPDEKIVTKLGRGIGGEIPGYLSRLNQLSIGGYAFEDVIVSAPFEGVYNKSIKRGSKYGTIGGELLHRFNVTIDYFNEKMYLQKSSRYKEAFEFDMSGLILNARGDHLNVLMIESITEGSPADLAGLMKGDIILEINGLNLRNSTLTEINGLLRKRANYRIKCKIWRGGDRLKKSFHLKRMI